MWGGEVCQCKELAPTAHAPRPCSPGHCAQRAGARTRAAGGRPMAARHLWWAWSSGGGWRGAQSRHPRSHPPTHTNTRPLCVEARRCQLPVRAHRAGHGAPPGVGGCVVLVWCVRGACTPTHPPTLKLSQVMMVASHPWDCHGALRAGLLAAYVQREGGRATPPSSRCSPSWWCAGLTSWSRGWRRCLRGGSEGVL